MQDLSADGIRAKLTTRRYGRSLELLEVTTSTNDVAKERARAGISTGYVVVADHQTAGRGSRGRVWSSPAGVDLYVSLVDRLDVRFEALPPLTLAVGLGVSRAVDATLADAATSARIKWPNDVLLAGQKCAGILVETSVRAGASPPTLIIGIGLNVNREAFDWPADERALPATSLRLHAGRSFDRNAVLATLLREVEDAVDAFVTLGFATLQPSIASRLAFLGEHVRVDEHVGELVGLRPDGAILIRSDGDETVQAHVAGALSIVARSQRTG